MGLALLALASCRHDPPLAPVSLVSVERVRPCVDICLESLHALPSATIHGRPTIEERCSHETSKHCVCRHREGGICTHYVPLPEAQS